ncbi:hypothetical protein DERP_007477 [Dermatophagoides pteronyssinus]|uniref:Uncharacterized protein n=1 Tax=Dermatophagoides pteronyssinus TaxID=6956 RepID=A0ABQ8J4H4_DERPT|nr:hypothetical protein DERP_007477 [Dermatophagoides pteronyssinus]
MFVDLANSGLQSVCFRAKRISSSDFVWPIVSRINCIQESIVASGAKNMRKAYLYIFAVLGDIHDKSSSIERPY